MGYRSMASLREKIEAELEQMNKALRELPGARRVTAGAAVGKSNLLNINAG
ncbi:MAG: hypothetical protein WCK27_10290 [Verrucomicrobiota bacterium]